MKTIISAPTDFDTWMRRHGPKQDTPAPKPAPAPAAPAPAGRGQWGNDPIPTPARGGSWEYMPSQQFGGDEDVWLYPTHNQDWYIGISRNTKTGEHCWGYVTPDGDVIDESGDLLTDNSGEGPGWQQQVERHDVEAWLRKEGVAETDMPTTDDWHAMAL